MNPLKLQAQSLNDVTADVLGPVDAADEMMKGVAMIAGVAMILGGLYKLFMHRKDPQHARLSTGIMLIFLGAILVLLGIIPISN